MHQTSRPCQYSYTAFPCGQTTWPQMIPPSTCDGQGIGCDWRRTKRTMAETTMDGILQLPLNIPKPPTGAAEAGSERTKNYGCILSPPPDWIWIPLPPGIILQHVLYPVGRSLRIVIYVLQGRQWWRGLFWDSHWDQLWVGVLFAARRLYSRPLVPSCLWLKVFWFYQ